MLFFLVKVTFLTNRFYLLQTLSVTNEYSLTLLLFCKCFMFPSIFCDSIMVFVSRREYVLVYNCLFLEEAGIPLIRLTPQHYSTLDFQHHISWSYYVYFIGCWFWRCCWNCWPSLFKLSFHKILKTFIKIYYHSKDLIYKYSSTCRNLIKIVFSIYVSMAM